MPELGWFVLLLVVFGGLAVVAAIVASRRQESRQLAGTGLAEWRREAAGYPWRDRWTMYRATQWGGSVPQRLHAPTLRRARVRYAVSERALEQARRLRWMWRVFGVVWVLLAALWITALLVDGSRWVAWVNVAAAALGLLNSMLYSERMQRRRASKARARVDALSS